VTDDPVADLVAVGIPVFRSLVLEHPALYRIAFQRIAPSFTAGPEVVRARERALAGLVGKVERLAEVDLLGEKTVLEAAVEFNAMLEGLANAELRGTILLTSRQRRSAPGVRLTTVARGFRAWLWWMCLLPERAHTRVGGPKNGGGAPSLLVRQNPEAGRARSARDDLGRTRKPTPRSM
jgi:hypothetical protein